MNGRTIRKLLMRGRTGTFFGSRALFVVRFSMTSIPEPLPPFTPLGLPLYQGCWTKENDDGTTSHFNIPELHGFSKPTPRTKHGLTADIHHAECVQSEMDSEGETTTRWIFYEGTETVYDKCGLVLSRKNIPAEVVNAYLKRRLWIKKYASGESEEWSGLDWLDELQRAANYANRFQPLLQDKALSLAYFVKWYHPKTMRLFCAQMHHALMVAKRAGVVVRIARPPRRSKR